MPNKTSALEWLRIAYHDLLSATILYDAEHFTDSIGNDLQQSIEKILKSISAYHSAPIKKSHDLLEIYGSLKETFLLSPDELAYLERATEYFKEDRYPNPYYSLPSREEIKEVLDFTNTLFERVCGLLNISIDEIKAIWIMIKGVHMGEGLVRCRQRMVNYTKSLTHLGSTVEKESLNEIEKAGLIQFFEVAFELSWKVMKDYLITEGYDVKSPREAIKTAFDYGLISDGAKWLEALEKRNLAAHTYDEAILYEFENLIKNTYYPMMEQLKLALESKCGE